MIQEVLGHAVRPHQKKHRVWVKSLISFYLNQWSSLKYHEVDLTKDAFWE